MAKHTPGRLEVSETYSTHNHPERFWNTPVLADGKLVAIAAGATEEESRANAIRLSAVNGLLEACEAVWADWCENEAATDPDSDGYATLQKVQAAIAKAKSPCVS